MAHFNPMNNGLSMGIHHQLCIPDNRERCQFPNNQGVGRPPLLGDCPSLLANHLLSSPVPMSPLGILPLLTTPPPGLPPQWPPSPYQAHQGLMQSPPLGFWNGVPSVLLNPNNGIAFPPPLLPMQITSDSSVFHPGNVLQSEPALTVTPTKIPHRDNPQEMFEWVTSLNSTKKVSPASSATSASGSESSKGGTWHSSSGALVSASVFERDKGSAGNTPTHRNSSRHESDRRSTSSGHSVSSRSDYGRDKDRDRDRERDRDRDRERNRSNHKSSPSRRNSETSSSRSRERSRDRDRDSRRRRSAERMEQNRHIDSRRPSMHRNLTSDRNQEYRSDRDRSKEDHKTNGEDRSPMKSRLPATIGIGDQQYRNEVKLNTKHSAGDAKSIKNAYKSTDEFRGRRDRENANAIRPIDRKRKVGNDRDSSSRVKRERKNDKSLSFELEAELKLELDDEEVMQDVAPEPERWVRSAPDELYYERAVSGLTKAKERTKLLCDKFRKNLIVRATTARLEAEQYGVAKMEELIETEKTEIEEQKVRRQEKKRKKLLESTSHQCQCKPTNAVKTESEGKTEELVEINAFNEIMSCSSTSCTSASTSTESEVPLNCSDVKDSNLIDNGIRQTGNESNESIQFEKMSSSEDLNDVKIKTEAVDNEDVKEQPLVEYETKVELLSEEELEEGEVDDDEDEEEKPKGLLSDLPIGEDIVSDEEFADSDEDKGSAKRNAKSKKATVERSNKKSNQKQLRKNQSNKTAKKSQQKCNHQCSHSRNSTSDSSESDDSDSCSSSEDEMSRSDTASRELERRKQHPRRLHEELWHNDPGLMNDGPVCRCSAKARRCGIRHGFYPGEDAIPLCDPFTNNIATLHHYRITINPPKNFLVNTPTVINHDGHEYMFEGFSVFSHYRLDLKLPPCRVIRFNIRYDVFIEEEKFPESFCVKELQLFETYIFREILELVDLRYDGEENGTCSQFHLMPRFVRNLPDNGKEMLSMSRVLLHLLKNDREVIKEEQLKKLYSVEQTDWQDFADKHKGMIVSKFGMKPSSIRVDQIDRDISGQEHDESGIPFPLIVHFGIRPPQLSYAGNAGYQRAWRRYVKYRHLLSNMPKPSAEDKRKLLLKEMKLQEMRTASTMKRDVTVAVSAKGFRATGIFCDLVQHAMLIPVLVAHLRFHTCLAQLENSMEYQFKNRYLLQLAMTHPSYRENFGTNPDHARNALTNCGIRQPEYGDRRIHYASTRKRGINTLINIMARFGADEATESEITHNERLEFLGDAVVEFMTSIHLFHIFPDLEEGGLATYRAAIVQNQHLAVLAQSLQLDQFMLYAHGSDLCHDSELRHAMANCFEALMGALFLDVGSSEVWSQISVAETVFAKAFFSEENELSTVWSKYPKHPLQVQEPNGDRHWIESHSVLQDLANFEESIGVEFTHIRILARAFTDRSLGYNNLSQGSNQRLEFLGDTVLQLISSEYLYRHFPDHHEGHLSLLRSSLVNNRTQSIVCDDLGMPRYAMRGDPKAEMKTKDKADLLEAFLGALYVDKGLEFCAVFCSVCFFPRLNQSIVMQEWNDPKSKLQQCCLTLRAMDGKEPDIPVYKVTESLGPTNTRIYIVAVYFRGRRLATAQGHSIQEAEMNAAALALEKSGHLFPQLNHQKRVLDKTAKKKYR